MWPTCDCDPAKAATWQKSESPTVSLFTEILDWFVGDERNSFQHPKEIIFLFASVFHSPLCITFHLLPFVCVCVFYQAFIHSICAEKDLICIDVNKGKSVTQFKVISTQIKSCIKKSSGDSTCYSALMLCVWNSPTVLSCKISTHPEPRIQMWQRCYFEHCIYIKVSSSWNAFNLHTPRLHLTLRTDCDPIKTTS